MIINAITHILNSFWRSLAAVLLLIAMAASASAAVGDWAVEGGARVRLVAEGVGADGRIAAGIEIELEPGWKTYWRTPGDAGIAPAADFAASTNLGGPVEIAYPVPHRIDDGYAVTNVYEGRVVLPVSAPVVDPASEVELLVGFDIGICDEVCVPAHYDLALDLAAGETDSEAGAILAEARSELPASPEPDIFAVERILRSGGTDKRPVFDVEIVAPDAKGAELFVEGPADWYPALPKLVASDGERATYSVEFSRLGAKTPIGGNEFRITVVSAGRAIEDVVRLD